MDFKKGKIDGVVAKPLKKWIDERGWLVETHREDELEQAFLPMMSYTSSSLPGTQRGPHEHAEQADLFVFLGPGNFKIWLWDNRKNSPTFGNCEVLFGGQDSPLQLLVPPGVVHAYKNVSECCGVVQNFPNQLYAGKNKQFPVDEIRHEADPNTPFKTE